MNKTPMNVFYKYLDGDKLTLVDVGTRGGISDRWKKYFPLLKVIGFEPDQQECEKINDSAKTKPYELICYPYALGSLNNKKTSLNICKDHGCISVYEPNMEFVNAFHYAPNMKVTSTIEITLSTLDEVCKNTNIIPDAIKIDTQGYELEILKGALGVLEKVKFLELEVEFNPQYKNQPLFSDVDLFMREHGFLLLGIRRTYWRRTSKQDFPKSSYGGQLMHGDAIYYNAKHLKNMEGSSLKELIKYCAIFSVYKQDDFISHLMSRSEGILQEIPLAERKAIARAFINKKPKSWAIQTRILDILRKKLWLPHRTLRQKVDNLHSSNSVDWHDPDFF